MLRGGLADKWGNSYEARWTLLEALRVLQGLAHEIRIEPFNEDAGGLEFRIDVGARREWHQCKRRRGVGTWTVRALAQEGVLAPFARKLADPVSDCVFISGDPAPELKDLCERAQLAGTATDFLDAVRQSQGAQAAFATLLTSWRVTEAVAYDGLRRTRVVTAVENQLDDQLERFCSLFFTAAPAKSTQLLLGHLDAELTRRITTESLRAAVETLDLGWRARFDHTLAQRVNDATNLYLDSLGAPVAIAEAGTPELAAVREAALDGEKRLVLVSGGAGSGKSLALAGVVRAARARAWPVLALRIDRYLDAGSLEALGEAVLGRAENPVGAFGNRFGLEPCVLVLDQVDAISEASGRSGRSRDMVLRMLRDAALYPQMRVVAACRVYDLENDTRLAALAAQDSVASLRLPQLDWERAVAPALLRLGLNPGDFSAGRRAILSTAINLRLFVTLAEAGAAPGGEFTGAALFEALVALRGRELTAAGVTWTPEAPLAVMADWMSRFQALAAPKSVLGAFPNAEMLLSSAGLVTTSAGQVQFAHESFFDHTYSAAFVARGESLLNLLVADQQRLFRRTQVRQILARLRTNTPARHYLHELRAVLEAPNVRYLVKDAVAVWLASLEDPRAAEFALLEPWFMTAGPLQRFAHVALAGAGWQRLLINNGAVLRWISGDGLAHELGLRVLQRSAVEHAPQVAEVLRAWWCGRPERLAALLRWFETLYYEGSIGVLEGLYAEAVAAVPDADVKLRLRDNFDLDSWVHRGHGQAARALGVWVTRWLAAYPLGQLFEMYDAFDGHGLEELAKHAPEALLVAILPALAESMRRETRGLKTRRTAFPTLRVPSDEDHNALGAVAVAVDRVAAANGRRVAGLLRVLPSGAEVALWLRLRAIASNGRALGHRLPALLSQPGIFELGYGGNWMAAADAARSALPHLGAGERDAVEGAILNYFPEIAWAKRCLVDRSGPEDGLPTHVRTNLYIVAQLKRSGEAQRAILTRIGEDVLSIAARRRLVELGRKFGDRPIRETRGGVGWVASPIGQEQAARMTDAHWLKAMGKYDDTASRSFQADQVIGGAEQLAHVLREATKADPTRFAGLLTQIPDTANPAYPLAIVDGIGGAQAPVTQALRALQELSRWPQAGAERSVAWLVQRVPGVGSDPHVLASLIAIAETGEASDTHVTTTNPPEQRTLDQLLSGGDLESSGINGERGSAWEALAAVLWHDGGVLEPIAGALERRLEAEPLTSVRMCMFSAIHAVTGRDEAHGLDLFRRAALRDPRSLLGRSGRRALNWAVAHRSHAVPEVVETLIGSTDEGLRALGLQQAAVLAMLDPAREPSLCAVWQADELARRVGALAAARNLGAARVAERAAAWLAEFFSDASADVREEAAKVHWEYLFETGARPDLLEAFVDSPAFDDRAGLFLHALVKRLDDQIPLTRQALRRVLSRPASPTEQRWGRTGVLEITPMLMALIRHAESDLTLESEALDLFDLYLAGDHYGVRDALAGYERD